MPEDDCPNCPPLTHRPREGVEVRVHTPESTGPMPEGHIMAPMPERLRNHRTAPHVLKRMSEFTQRATIGREGPQTFRPAEGISLWAEQPQAPAGRTQSTPERSLSGPHFISSSIILSGPLNRYQVGELGVANFQTQDDPARDVILLDGREHELPGLARDPETGYVLPEEFRPCPSKTKISATVTTTHKRILRAGLVYTRGAAQKIVEFTVEQYGVLGTNRPSPETRAEIDSLIKALESSMEVPAEMSAEASMIVADYSCVKPCEKTVEIADRTVESSSIGRIQSKVVEREQTVIVKVKDPRTGEEVNEKRNVDGYQVSIWIDFTITWDVEILVVCE